MFVQGAHVLTSETHQNHLNVERISNSHYMNLIMLHAAKPGEICTRKSRIWSADHYLSGRSVPRLTDEKGN